VTKKKVSAATMTRQTFYRKLRKAAPKFRWENNPETGMIRGTPRIGSNINTIDCAETDACPMNGVYGDIYGQLLSNYQLTLLANALGVSLRDKELIVSAADGYHLNIKDEFGTPRQKRAVRNAILRAVGLTP
jgi:hypothetical protein